MKLRTIMITSIILALTLLFFLLPGCQSTDITTTPTEESKAAISTPPTHESTVPTTTSPTTTAPTAEDTAPTVETTVPIDQNDCTNLDNGFRTGNFNGSPACIKDGKLHICRQNFEDGSFYTEMLAQFNRDKDYLMTLDEVKEVTSFTCSGLSTVKGIEYFTGLESLYVNAGELTVLDLSLHMELKRLSCMNQKLETLIIGSTKLEFLDCQLNNLTKLDLSDKLNLRELICDHNPLKTLEIPSKELRVLSCRLTMLERLDVSHMVNLEQIDCCENQITSLDFNNHTKLKVLFCGGNQLTELHIDRIDGLVELICDNNQLTKLDIGNHTNLRFLSCLNNQISTLDLRGKDKLIQINCQNNRLTELNLRDLTRLEVLECHNNLLTSLDFSTLTRLRDANAKTQTAPAPAVATPTADGKAFLVNIGSIVGYENIGLVHSVYNNLYTSYTNVPYDPVTGVATITDLRPGIHILLSPKSARPEGTYDYMTITVQLQLG